MELDLNQVRAFVVTAEQLHFGRAAARLFITQQALSKRVQRLEHTLGERLLRRGPRGVELTDAGSRFLPHARRLLAAADAAIMAARPASWPLRVDVWGQVQAPLRLVRRMLTATPELVIEPSMRRSLAAAIQALGRGELDACFGRPHDLDRAWPAGLARQPVTVERLAVAVGAEHPLAGAASLGPGDLAASLLWMPGGGSAPELLGYARRVVDWLGVALDTSGHNLGLDHVADQLRPDRRRFTLVGVDWPLPARAGLRLVPLVPAPLFVWSLVWHEGNQHPLLGLLVDRAIETSRSSGWLDYDPERDWLPDPDLGDLRRGR
jgi:DNA-binding transcriptional LysR family regulator